MRSAEHVAMTKPDNEMFFHATPNEELCTDGSKHDFQGWIDLKDENGYVCGGTTVCTKCGLDAFTHSLRYGP